MSALDNMKAFALGAEAGAPIADRFRGRKARNLYSEAMGGIPMPGQEGAAPGGAGGPDTEAEEQNSWSAKAAREKLAEAMAVGSNEFGIDDYKDAINSLAQRSYIGANRSYEEYKAALEAGDDKAAASALNRLYRYLPTKEVTNIVADPNNPGTFYAPVVDPETGEPMKEVCTVTKISIDECGPLVALEESDGFQVFRSGFEACNLRGNWFSGYSRATGWTGSIQYKCADQSGVIPLRLNLWIADQQQDCSDRHSEICP